MKSLRASSGISRTFFPAVNKTPVNLYRGDVAVFIGARSVLAVRVRPLFGKAISWWNMVREWCCPSDCLRLLSDISRGQLAGWSTTTSSAFRPSSRSMGCEKNSYETTETQWQCCDSYYIRIVGITIIIGSNAIQRTLPVSIHVDAGDLS